MDVFDSIHLAFNQNITLAHQLKQQITMMIAGGMLKPGDQLPPVQKMAERLGINLHTVRHAYSKLSEEGLVDYRRGRGTHVLEFDLARLSQIDISIRSHTIGVILPSWSNPFYHSLLQGIEEIAEEDMSLLFLCNTHDDQNVARRDFARLTAKQVDGILLASTDITQIVDPSKQDFTIPFVVIDLPGYSGYSALIDLQQVGYLATQHLLEHGHRRIGLITFVIDGENTEPLIKGFKQALTEYGISPETELIARVPGFDMDSGEAGAQYLLALKEPPTAIFAITDLMALGAMKAIKEAGLQIPADIAIVSFNDIPAAALVEPALTTVKPPTMQLGREAMKMLRTLIAGELPPKREIILESSLVIRESCGCMRKEG